MGISVKPGLKVETKAKKVDILEYLELKNQYDKHEKNCKEISKEINKWGKKTIVKLNFLKKKH